MAKRKLTKRADGRYQSQIYLGTDENGKRIIKTLYGRTQKELEEKECLLKVKLSRGFDIKAERKTFGEWAELFLRMKESKNVSAGRLANYGYALMKFEPLYQYPLEKLYPIDFQRIIDSWAKENPNTGKPSSKALLTEMKRAANGGNFCATEEGAETDSDGGRTEMDPRDAAQSPDGGYDYALCRASARGAGAADVE